MTGRMVALLIVSISAAIAVCVIGDATQPPRCLPVTDVEMLDTFDRLIADLERRHEGKELESWPEPDRSFWGIYQSGRRELLANHSGALR